MNDYQTMGRYIEVRVTLKNLGEIKEDRSELVTKNSTFTLTTNSSRSFFASSFFQDYILSMSIHSCVNIATLTCPMGPFFTAKLSKVQL